MLSSFVSEITRTPRFHLIGSVKKLCLFLRELMLRCAKSKRFRFLIQTSLRLLKTISSAFVSKIRSQVFQNIIYQNIILFYLNGVFSLPDDLP